MFKTYTWRFVRAFLFLPLQVEYKAEFVGRDEILITCLTAFGVP